MTEPTQTELMQDPDVTTGMQDPDAATGYRPSAYSPPVLRIAATYPVPAGGEHPPAGHPDNVEVEVNPAQFDLDPAGVSAAFVTEIVASLFRHAAAGAQPAVTIDPAAPSLPHPGIQSAHPGIQLAPHPHQRALPRHDGHTTAAPWDRRTGSEVA